MRSFVFPAQPFGASLFITCCSLSCGWLFACSSPGSAPPDPMASGGASGSGTGGSVGVGGTTEGTGGSDDAGVGGAPSSPWPDGKLAAVSLTYDDGLDGQLKHAVPALDARGLQGTFYLSSFQGVEHNWALPDPTSPLNARHMAWQAVAASGHELGGHTIYHPCDNNNADYKPEAYTEMRMAEELDESILRLKRLTPTDPVSFAYPCYGDVVGIQGGASYMPLVNERFSAARTSAEGVSDPLVVDLANVAQRFGDGEGMTAEALTAYVDEAIAAGGWAVFTIHGVGPEALDCDINQFNLEACALNYLVVNDEAHQALLDYLVSKQEQVWTAPFGTVAQHIQSSRM